MRKQQAAAICPCARLAKRRCRACGHARDQSCANKCPTGKATAHARNFAAGPGQSNQIISRNVALLESLVQRKRLRGSDLPWFVATSNLCDCCSKRRFSHSRKKPIGSMERVGIAPVLCAPNDQRRTLCSHVGSSEDVQTDPIKRENASEFARQLACDRDRSRSWRGKRGNQKRAGQLL